MKLKVLKMCFKLGIPLQGIAFLFLYNNSSNNYHRAKYDWRYWTYIDECETKTIPIPEKYAKLMLAYWIAINGNFKKTREWYYATRHMILLHPSTKYWIEHQFSKTLEKF